MEEPFADPATMTPAQRRREIAGILAAGLLRLRARPQLAATSDISDEYVRPPKNADSAQKALGLPATPRPDPPTPVGARGNLERPGPCPASCRPEPRASLPAQIA